MADERAEDETDISHAGTAAAIDRSTLRERGGLPGNLPVKQVQSKPAAIDNSHADLESVRSKPGFQRTYVDTLLIKPQQSSNYYHSRFGIA